MSLTFMVTVEYICPNMCEEEELKRDFNNDPMEAYRYVSDNFTDSPAGFCDSEKVVKVEVIKEATNEP